MAREPSSVHILIVDDNPAVGIPWQRLLRTICSGCREPYEPPRHEIEMVGALPPGETMLYRGSGCNSYLGTGYRGRTAVFEVLPITDDVAELVTRDAWEHEVRTVADVPSLRDSGISKVLAGITTAQEVRRVIGLGMDRDQEAAGPVLAPSCHGPSLNA
jgi:type II secretory ATPase GspE/PulE/Tfp pilus assembly ATPase PilB-like protein